jgi:phospholipase/carboxylesterase
LPDLKDKPVLLLLGASDTMIPAASSQRLAAVLQSAGARLIAKTLAAGHNLTQDDLVIAKNWLEQLQ